MDLFEHEKKCVKELGEPWTEIHVFMDKFMPKYRGFLHRRLLHHKLGIDLAVVRFGESARPAATLHVIQDFGFVPDTWNDLGEHSFFLGDEETEQEKDLKELYGKKVFCEIESGDN